MMSNVRHYDVASGMDFTATLATITSLLDTANDSKSLASSTSASSTSLDKETLAWWGGVRFIIIDSFGALMTPIVGGTSTTGNVDARDMT
jgi:hypothetical protein